MKPRWSKHESRSGCTITFIFEESRLIDSVIAVPVQYFSLYIYPRQETIETFVSSYSAASFSVSFSSRMYEIDRREKILGDSSVCSRSNFPISHWRRIDTPCTVNFVFIQLSLVTFSPLILFFFFFPPFFLSFFFFFVTLLHRLNRVSAIDCEASQLREKSMKEVKKKKKKKNGEEGS